MCAPPAQRDLGQIGKRNVMKRHTTSCAIPPTKKLLLCECEVCGKELRGRKGLNKHMEIHKNEQRYKCSFCPLRFNTNSKMRGHEKKQHKPESISPLEKLEVPAKYG